MPVYNAESYLESRLKHLAELPICFVIAVYPIGEKDSGLVVWRFCVKWGGNSLRIIQKGLAYYHHHGFFSTIKQVIDKCRRELTRLPNICKERLKKKKVIAYLKEKVQGKNVYVMIPCIDWNIPLFQRPHQIAKTISAQRDSIVFFIPDQYRYDNFSFIQKITDSLYLYSAHMVSALDEILSDAVKVTVIMCWTMHFELLSKFHYNKLVYEYVDEVNLLYFYDDDMENKHRILMQKADLTIATASTLFSKAKPYARKLMLSPNAGDYDFFRAHRGCPVHHAISDIVKKYSCVLGYYGALAKWFDYDLIMEIALRRQDWLFVLVGYNFDGSLSRISKLALPNVLHLEARPYQELPSFVSGFDIQIIPFIVNDITVSVSPVKLFEYMASQKPILTSNIPECRKYRSVTCYTDTDDFQKKVEILLNKRDNPEYQKVMDKEAQENTWRVRVNQILKGLDGDNG